MKWIQLDKNNLPKDGSYIARMDIPGRMDNPGYNKIRIMNGQCHEHFLDMVTHYAVDEGIDGCDTKKYNEDHPLLVLRASKRLGLSDDQKIAIVKYVAQRSIDNASAAGDETKYQYAWQCPGCGASNVVKCDDEKGIEYNKEGHVCAYCGHHPKL